MVENFQNSLHTIRRLILSASLLVAVVVVAVIGFVPFDEKVPATGVIIAEEEVFLYAPDSMVIREIHVREGSSVTNGERLISLDTRDLENRRAELEAELHEATAQAQLKQVQFDRIVKLPLPKEFWHARTELAEAESEARHATVERQRYTELLKGNLTSQSDFDKRQLAEEQAFAARDKARANVAVLEQGLEKDILKEAAADLTATTTKVERLKTELALCANQIELRELRAPVDGQVTLLLKNRAGEAVTKGEELIHLSHGQGNRARLFVGESQIHRIRPGQHVRLRSRAFDTIRYGYVEARVDEVALEPRPSETAGTAGRYLVKVQIEKTPLPLALGSTVDGDIILRRGPIWEWFIPQRGEKMTSVR